MLPSGSNWEIELRGASIWCVELIKREIEKRHPEVKHSEQNKPLYANHGHQREDPNGSSGKDKAAVDAGISAKHDDALIQESVEGTDGHAYFGVNSILIDFFLYDTMKALEREQAEIIPHHRTRSIWY